MIKIGEFAKICNTGTQTLRYYDSVGVLRADFVDEESGYRFYAPEAVEKYKKIVFYKELGFSLDEIKKLQSLPAEETRTMLLSKKKEMNAAIKNLQAQVTCIDTICESPSLQYPLLQEMLRLPFTDDPEVIGKWELCGELPKLPEGAELPGTAVSDCRPPSCPCAEEIVFLPGGAPAWQFSWTKGILYRMTAQYGFLIPNPYRIVSVKGENYMLLQYLSSDCIDNGKDSITLLYRQLDRVAYTEWSIRRHIDKIDLPFVEDPAVSGEWLTVDFVSEIDAFDPEKENTGIGDRYIEKIAFLPRGVFVRTVRTGAKSGDMLLRYTKGFILNERDMTAEEYILQTIDGKDYLFIQHKSGDYYYGGMKPHYYVFKRKETPT